METPEDLKQIEEEKKILETNQAKNSEYSQFRLNTENRYKAKMEKQEEAHKKELEELNKKYTFETDAKPKIQQEYFNQGGKAEHFNDFLKLNGAEIDLEKLDISIHNLQKNSSWAFDNSTISDQVKAGLGKQGTIDNSKYEPGQIYLKNPRG